MEEIKQFDAMDFTDSILTHLKMEKLRIEIREKELQLAILEKENPPKPEMRRWQIIPGVEGTEASSLTIYQEENSATLEFLPGEVDMLIGHLKPVCST